MLLCATVSSLSVVISVVVLAFATQVKFTDALIIALIAIAFSTAEIFIATRMDLNGARLSSTLAEMKSASNRTIAKGVPLGILLALFAGTLSLVSYILAIGNKLPVIKELGLTMAHAYVLPAIIAAVYLIAAITYYSIRIKKSLEGLSI